MALLLQRVKLFALACSFFGIIFFLTSNVLAETVTIANLPFQVDEISQIDDSSVKLVIDGRAEIIFRASLEDRIVQTILSNPAHAAKLQISALKKFAEDVLKQGHYDWASYAALAILSKGGSLQENQEFLDNLLSTDNGTELGKLILVDCMSRLDIGVPKGIEPVVLSVGLKDIEWLKSQAIRLAYSIRGELDVYFKRQIYKLFRARNFSEAKRLVQVRMSLFGNDSDEFSNLAVLTSRMITAVSAAESGDVDPLFALYDVAKSDNEIGDVLSPVVIEAIHREAGKVFSAGNYSKVFSILCRIDLKRRTPTTHDLVKRSLNNLQPANDSIVTDPLVGKFLSLMSEQDQDIKQAYLDYLDREVNFLIKSGRIDAVENYLPLILMVRPDPDASNDAIRVEQAKAYLASDMFVSANTRMRDVRTSLTITQRLSLLLHGYYGGIVFILSIALIPIILAVLVILRIRQASTTTQFILEKKEEPAPIFDDQSEDSLPSGFSVGKTRMQSPLMREYKDLLQVLGLKPGVDLRDIKAAYRHHIKGVHPDLNKDLSNADKDRFMDLTRTYERLIEIRKEMGLPE